MPTGQSSWARRLIGLARSRQLLRRIRVLWGDAVLAPIVLKPSPVPLVMERSGELPHTSVVPFREWAAKLSQSSVALLIEDDHVVLQEDTEVIASGFLVGSRRAGSVGGAIT